jgi:hypothetical protein
MGIVEGFGGPKVIVAMSLTFVLYQLMVLSPVLWPALRAFRKQDPPPRPWLFGFVIATLTYSSMFFLLIVVGTAIDAISAYIAPMFNTISDRSDDSASSSEDKIAAAWGFAIWLLTYFAVITLLYRKLAPKWRKICEALAA